MTPRVRMITENTGVSMAVVITLVGGIVFVTNTHWIASANSRDIGEIKAQSERKAESDQKFMTQVLSDLAVIRAELDLIKKQTKYK